MVLSVYKTSKRPVKCSSRLFHLSCFVSTLSSQTPSTPVARQAPAATRERWKVPMSAGMPDCCGACRIWYTCRGVVRESPKAESSVLNPLFTPFLIRIRCARSARAQQNNRTMPDRERGLQVSPSFSHAPTMHNAHIINEKLKYHTLTAHMSCSRQIISMFKMPIPYNTTTTSAHDVIICKRLRHIDKINRGMFHKRHDRYCHKMRPCHHHAHSCMHNKMMGAQEVGAVTRAGERERREKCKVCARCWEKTAPKWQGARKQRPCVYPSFSSTPIKDATHTHETTPCTPPKAAKKCQSLKRNIYR